MEPTDGSETFTAGLTRRQSSNFSSRNVSNSRPFGSESQHGAGGTCASWKFGALLVGGGTGGRDLVNKGNTSGKLDPEPRASSLSNCKAKGGNVAARFKRFATTSFKVFASPGHRWHQGQRAPEAPGKPCFHDKAQYLHCLLVRTEGRELELLAFSPFSTSSSEPVSPSGRHVAGVGGRPSTT